MEIWEIIIHCDNGPAYSILGDEDTLKAELTAWREYQEQSTQEFEEHKAQPDFLSDSEPFSSSLGFQVRVIEGFQDVTRHPAIMGYRFNEVQAMTLRRIS